MQRSQHIDYVFVLPWTITIGEFLSTKGTKVVVLSPSIWVTGLISANLISKTLLTISTVTTNIN